MKYASSPLLIFRQFLLSLAAAAMLTGLAVAGLMWLGVASPAPLYGIAVLALASCVGHVAIKGRVRIEVTEDEVVVTRPLENAVRFSRKQFSFSSRVVAHSVNFIPVETERVLIAANDRETCEVVLTNLAKKPFDAVMAALLKDRVLAAAAETGTPAETAFVVPKERMLADFRKLIVIFAVAGGVLCLGLIGFIGYMLANADTDVPVLPMLVKTGGFCLLMFVGFGVPVFLTYQKRERAIPAAVRVTRDRLEFGDEHLPFAEIRRIVATPPDYAAGDFVATRTIAVTTDHGKRPFHFGPRTPAGVWKNVFGEYGELCRALETAAARHGIEFIYDL